MNYDIRLSERAAANLNSLPLPVKQTVANLVFELRQSPSIGRPANVDKFPSGGMSAHCEAEFDGFDYYVYIIYRFGSDEKTLLVNEIRHWKVKRDT